jgi:hypothetical protein
MISDKLILKAAYQSGISVYHFLVVFFKCDQIVRRQLRSWIFSKEPVIIATPSVFLLWNIFVQLIQTCQIGSATDQSPEASLDLN